MGKFKNLILLAVCTVFISACQTKQPPKPVAVPVVTVKSQPVVKHPLGIIGAVEPIYILPMSTPFQARIDTGAETSSLDVDEYHYFERDGEKWVSFQITNSANGKSQKFEKRLQRRVAIRRIKSNEKRPIVKLDVKFGGKVINAEFTLAKREKFDYQVLIGRNIITGRAVIDTALSNTLR